MSRVLVAFFLALIPALCLGWGDDGHIYVNRVAAQKIPDSMPAFLRNAAERLAYLGPEPDRWRGSSEYALKTAQEPDHFIDLELADELGELPPGRYEFYELCYRRHFTERAGDTYPTPDRIGLLPYITIEIFDRLKVAFRDYRTRLRLGRPTDVVEPNIIYYAGLLGHYVADGAQPLHTTIHYDGWIGANPKNYRTSPGIHSEFETVFVSRNVAAADFADRVHSPTWLSTPFDDFMRYLRESRSLVEKVYELDQLAAFTGSGTQESLGFVRGRLAAGSQMLLNLWYTAWVESSY